MNINGLENNTFASDRLIVKYKTPEKAAQVRSSIGASLSRSLSSLGLEFWKLPEGLSVPQALSALERNPNIEYAEPDYEIRLESTSNDTYFNLLWGLNNTGQTVNGTSGTADADIDAPEAWDISTGDSNVVVGVIDTGVDYTHPDLNDNIWVNPGEIADNGIDDDGNGYIDDVYGWDFFNNDNDPMDDQYHGTHVAGTIAAEGNNGTGVVGVNWNASIMALKFLNSSGSGYTSDAIAAINYATMMGADITNNSWGGGGYSQALKDAIDAAGAAGQLFIAAAGNSAVNTDSSPHYPSSYDSDNIISVAATDSSDNLASFSNYGATSVDLAAPGVSIASTVPNEGYDYLNGTSMAAPHVAGVAALIWSVDPTLTASEVKNTILSTVDPVTSLDGITVTGGRLNAFNALESLSSGGGGSSGSGSLSVSINSAEISENGGTSTATVTRSDTSGDLIVSLSSDDTTEATVPESVTILDGYTSASFTVTGVNDAITDGTQTVTITASATDYTNGTDTIDVTDDDEPAEPPSEITADSGTRISGTASGSYTDTHTSDNAYLTITEEETKGNPRNRYSFSEYHLTFNDSSFTTNSQTLYIEAFRTNNSEGDDFRVEYSDNGGSTWTWVIDINSNTEQVYTVSGLSFSSNTVEFRIRDLDRTPGNNSLDSVSIDKMHLVPDAGTSSTGSNNTDSLTGLNSLKTLTGIDGINETFVLLEGRNDLLVIEQFNPGEDRIQLQGQQEDYRLSENTFTIGTDTAFGTGIYLKVPGETEGPEQLLGIVKGLSELQLNLNDLSFV